MPMYEYQTLTYIMYRESLERQEREAAEEKAKQARADEEQKRKNAEAEANRPLTQAEIILRARRNAAQQQMMNNNKEENPVQEPLQYEPSGISLDEVAEFLEDEL